MKFKFRVWSTKPGVNQVFFPQSQSEALMIVNVQHDFDRVDYNANDWHGWRFVDIDVLNNSSIAAIYATDKRFDDLRIWLYIVAGLSFACIGATALFLP